MPTFELITILPLNPPPIHVLHFVLTSLSDALVTFVSDQVTWRPLQPLLSTGSEHQGQNSISNPDQNLGFICIFSSGMQESLFFLPQPTNPLRIGQTSTLKQMCNRTLVCHLLIHLKKHVKSGLYNSFPVTMRHLIQN